MKTRPRILFVAPLPDPVTGQSLACRVLLDDLINDYDVDVIDMNRNFSDKGRSVFRHILRLASNVAAMGRLHSRADLIYYNNVESFAGNIKDLFFYGAAFGSADRMVVHLHGGAGMREIMKGRYPFLARLNRFFLRRAGAVVVLGPRLRKIYEGHLSDDCIKTAENFAEDRWFSTDDQIRDKFGSTDPIRLLFLSNLLTGKGHVELATAFLRLEPTLRAKFRLDFAGGAEDAESDAAFRQLITAAPEITYHGTVRGDAKGALLSAAHVFCLPTYYPYEGQPISVLEAYAAGAAVITTDHSGIFDIFTDGENGWAVEKGSVASLEDRLRSIAAAPASLESIGVRNASAARKTYRVEHFVGRMRPIIRSVLEN